METGTVELVFWDVQHGHSTYIKSPNGRHIIIDLGIGNYDTLQTSFSPLMFLKNRWGVQQLDRVVITHPHLDHIDDILNLSALRPKVLLVPTHLSNAEILGKVRSVDLPKFTAYCDFVNSYNQPVSTSGIDYYANPDNWGGMTIEHYVPTFCNHNNFNNHSIVTVIQYMGMKVVIPGDNETPSFEELFLQAGFKEAVQDADILLAPHHGRQSGYNSEFIDLVNPRITIVSDGRFCDTSANARYSSKSRGWTVHRSGGSVFRRCLTTNSDKEVYVKLGLESNGNRFLEVNIK